MAKNTPPSRDEWLREADKYDSLKETVSLQSLENARFIRADLSGWYNALTAVCFTAGTIAITLSSDKAIRQNIIHPTYFWWGSLLLIANGVYIFLLKKSEIERDDRESYKLRETEADLWTLRNVSRELADGNNSRVSEFKKVKESQTAAYDKVIKDWNWKDWLKHLILASRIDVVFGLLLFPVLMITSQITPELGISYSDYKKCFFILLAMYVLYSVYSAYISAQTVKKKLTADKRIKEEVYRDRD